MKYNIVKLVHHEEMIEQVSEWFIVNGGYQGKCIFIVLVSRMDEALGMKKVTKEMSEQYEGEYIWVEWVENILLKSE